MRTAKILFLGGGNMARCIVAGLIADGYDANAIWVVDPNLAKQQYFTQTLKVHATDDAHTVIDKVYIIVLAVKPQSLEKVANQFGTVIKQQKPLLISIAAGITLNSLALWFGEQTPIIRAMPNTPALVQAGATTLFANSTTSRQQKELAERILRATGLTAWMDSEDLMDVSTAIAGSSPGYFFYIMEAMEDSAVALGLDSKTARLLIRQAMFGSAKLALESQQDFAQLRAQVTSKAGATEAAIHSLAADELPQALERAIHAAKKRCEIMSQQFGPQKQLT